MATVTGQNTYLKQEGLVFRTGTTGTASLLYDMTTDKVNMSGIYNISGGSLSISGNPVMTGDSGYDSDTLQTVTDRGATTTNSISITSTSAGALAVDTDTLYVNASTDRVGINEDTVDATLHLTNVAGGVVNQKFERAGVSAWRLGIPNGETYFAFDDSNDDLSTPEMVITTDGNVCLLYTSDAADE